MKKLFIIEDTLENKISYYHLAAFLIALPFDRLYSELALISFTIHTLIHVNRQRLRSLFTSRTLLISSVFFITAIGILYSQDKAQSIKDLQRQSAIFLFPACLAISGIGLNRYKLKLLMIFSFTCVLTTLYLYFDALHIIVYNKLPLSQLFTQTFINHNFSEPISLHATYLGMYSLLSVCTLLYCILKETNLTKRLFIALAILILLAGLLQLASRSVLISAITIASFFPLMVLQGKKRFAFIGVSLVIASLLIYAIANTDAFKTRYISRLKEDLASTGRDPRDPEPRILRWQLALRLAKQSPIYGYGSGSEKRLLNETYFTNRLYISYLNELNAHNQYISIMLKTGAWGLAIFLLTLALATLTALRGKNILFMSFLLIVSIVSFSENILDVNKGIFFYAFFLSLFTLSGKPFERLFRLNNRQKQQDLVRPINKKENAATVRSDNYIQ